MPLKAPRQLDLRPGALLASYVLTERAGAGGMAEVWRAYQPSLQRDVAIKILPRRLADQTDYVDRFRREALAISRLEHPHILSIYDCGEQDGVLYLVTPFIGAGTLAERLGQPWPAAAAHSIIEPLASALDYAHRQGVVHRDIKPSNVLLTDQGQVILADFGIACLQEDLGQLTGAGMVIGTPAYMAPEQAAGEGVGPASDLYALGVILYELLTGRPPYQGSSPVALALAHLKEPLPPPRQFNPALSEAVETVLIKALAKDPAARYPSGAALVSALTQAQRVPLLPAAEPPSPARPGRRRLGALAGLLLLAAGLTVALTPAGAPLRQTLLGSAAPTPIVALERIPASGEPAAQPVQTMTPGRLLRSDDFADPTRGLFADQQRGSGRRAFSNGQSAEYRWESSYADGALAIRLLGPYPPNPDRALLGASAVARDRLLEDFAVEVSGRAVRSPSVGLYGLRYVLAPGDSYFFRIAPESGTYAVWWEGDPRGLSQGRTSALKRDGTPNALRIEVRGDSLRVFANGQLLDRVQHDGLARRGGQLFLFAEMGGPPPDGDLDVRFDDFKVYALAPLP